MDSEIMSYLISRDVPINDIKKLNDDLAEIQSKENNIFDIDFQKQILFNSAFLDSSQLCSLVNEMNRGDYVMVERILGQDCDKTFTPEEILQALVFSTGNIRERNINALLSLAIKKVQKKKHLYAI